MARAGFSQVQASAIVRHLAAPRFAGRRTGTPGHDRALRWIERRFRRLGFRPRRHRFVTDASMVRAQALPRASIAGDDRRVRAIRYRFDFVEHPASAALVGRLSGPIRRWRAGAPMRAGWALLDPERGSSASGSLHRQAQLAARRGAIGLLLPARVPSGGMFFKQPVPGRPFPRPAFLVREELLASAEGSGLELWARLRRSPLRGTNLIAERGVPTGEFALEPVIVGAHYDGVGDDPGGRRFPGASDNAVGVAIVLEIARVLRSEGRFGERPVWFVTFDAEEAGAFGSRALADEVRASGLRPIVLNVDAAVPPGRPFSIEGSPDARPLFAILDQVGRRLGAPLVLGAVPSDHRPFSSVGFTSVGIGVGGQGFHTPQDRADRIDRADLRRAGELALATLRELAG